jgi:GDP-4-dehydro-6-deoxy-D-mannose reductase
MRGVSTLGRHPFRLYERELVLPKAIITGISGFAGSHLAEYLLANTDWQIVGVYRPVDGTQNISHLLDRVDIRAIDILERSSVEDLVDEVRPDYVFHLAAQASVHQSLSQPAETIGNNALGQVNILEPIVRLQIPTHVLIIGSGDEYGIVRPDEVPVGEDQPFRPCSPYAVSKVTQDLLGLQYFITHKVHAIRVRPFNHIGPRQSDAFVVSNFAKQIAEIEAAHCEPVVRVGNLDAQRDFTDVRDIVRGYYLAITKGLPGEVYNLGTGKPWSIRDILDTLLNLSTAQIEVIQDPARLRPSDIPVLACDSSKFNKLTGWQPEIKLEQSLQDVLDYWRSRIS